MKTFQNGLLNLVSVSMTKIQMCGSSVVHREAGLKTNGVPQSQLAL